MMNKHRLTSPLLAIAVALLLLAVAFIGYQVVSAQTSQGTVVDGDAPPAPTGLTATNDGAGARLL